MRRVTMAKFKCISCGAFSIVELEHSDETPKLPLGWCALKGWWLEGIPSETEGKVAQDKVPLDIECCSYRCMEKALRADTQTQERTNALTPQAEPEEKPC